MLSQNKNKEAPFSTFHYIPKIEVILPVYNERENIPHLIHSLDQVKEQLKGKANLTYLFINDGSNDGTELVLNELFQNRNDTRVVNLLHNFGHNSALACGIDFFDGDAALIMDADLQDPPEALIKMFESWKAGAKTIVAERTSRKEKNSFLFKSFYYLLQKSSKKVPPINFGTHSLLDSSVIERIKTLKEKNRYFPGLVGFSSEKIVSVPIARESRKHGKSRVGIFGLINLAITAFLSFSATPVRLVSLFGLITSACSILGGLFIIGVKVFTDKAIPGWASTLSLIFFSTGIQLLCLGIIGEYIARIYEEVKERPLYLVSSTLEKS